MVPLLDYTKKDKELQEAFHTMEQKAAQNQELIDLMERKLRSERIAKWTYLALVGLLIVAEPILFVCGRSTNRGPDGGPIEGLIVVARGYGIIQSYFEYR